MEGEMAAGVAHHQMMHMSG